MTSPPPAKLDDREIEFLRESNAIERIYNVDYRALENQVAGAGHVGAWWASQALARGAAPLRSDDLCAWQKMVAEEQGRFGHRMPAGRPGMMRGPKNPSAVHVGGHVAPSFLEVESLMRSLLSDVNQRLDLGAGEPYWTYTSRICLVADSLCEFESIHPFPDGNGRVGRLLANFLVTRTQEAPIVFREAERADFFAAHRSCYAMRIFIAEKLREAVLWEGRVVLRKGGFDNADTYDLGADGTLDRHWHELLDAVSKWKRGEPADDAPLPGGTLSRSRS